MHSSDLSALQLKNYGDFTSLTILCHTDVNHTNGSFIKELNFPAPIEDKINRCHSKVLKESARPRSLLEHLTRIVKILNFQYQPDVYE
jgi:hypothetical protein